MPRNSEPFSISSLLHKCTVLCINLGFWPLLWGFPFILWGPQYASEISQFIQFNWLQQFYLQAPSQRSEGVEEKVSLRHEIWHTVLCSTSPVHWHHNPESGERECPGPLLNLQSLSASLTQTWPCHHLRCFPKMCFVSWGEDEDLDLHGQCFVGFPEASFRVPKSPKHTAPPVSHLCHDDVTWPKKPEA